MTYNSYLDSIALSDADLAYFRQILTRINAAATEEESNAIRAESINSPEGSFECKRYLMFCMPELFEARKWGLSRFAEADLYYLLLEVMVHNAKDMHASELKLLAMNPAFLASYGSEDFDVINLIFGEIPVESAINKIQNMLVRELIDTDLLNLEIAAHIIAANKSARYGHDASRRLVDEEPIIRWARKKYSLEEIPETWVRKLIGVP